MEIKILGLEGYLQMPEMSLLPNGGFEAVSLIYKTKDYDEDILTLNVWAALAAVLGSFDSLYHVDGKWVHSKTLNNKQSRLIIGYLDNSIKANSEKLVKVIEDSIENDNRPYWE